MNTGRMEFLLDCVKNCHPATAATLQEVIKQALDGNVTADRDILKATISAVDSYLSSQEVLKSFLGAIERKFGD